MTAFRVYFADLFEYNRGTIIGRWITPTDYDTVEELEAARAECLSDPSHESAVHDTEGVPVGEYESAVNIISIAEAVRDHGTELVRRFLDQGRCTDLECLSEAIADADCGEFESPANWAHDYVTSCYDLRSIGDLAMYIDYDAFARDAELNGDVTFVELDNGNVWVLGR